MSNTKPKTSESKDGRPQATPVRVRLDNHALAALDAFVAGHSEPTTRPQAIRAILTDWLRTHGLLKGDHPEPFGPATDVIRKMDAEIEEHRRSKGKRAQQR